MNFHKIFTCVILGSYSVISCVYAFVVAVSFCNCCCCCGIFGCRTVKNPVGDGVGPISSENYGFCHTITRIYLIPLSTAIIRLQFTNPPVKLFCNKNIFPKNFKLTRARTALPDGQKSLAIVASSALTDRLWAHQAYHREREFFIHPQQR